MTPQEIVHELDKHIVGQDRAKRAVAIALRNRWRRQQVAEPLRQEITPKNILMIGPTGVGKTEIARRLARLADAPFIKVEATKFTEVGYVGRDVDTIVRDLVEIAIKQAREDAMRQVRARAEDAAEERILDALLPPARAIGFAERTETTEDSATRQRFRKKLREGELDDKEIEIEVAATQAQMEILAPPGMEELTQQIQGMFQNLGGGRKKLRKLKVREAMRLLAEEEAGQARQRRGPEDARAGERRAERHRVPRRDRQDRQPLRDAGRRRLAPGRAARSAAARRGHDGLDALRHGEDRPHPLHRERRVPPRQALRPDPRAAGPLPDPRRARLAHGRRLRAHPHRDRRVPGQAVRGAARHRGREARVPARRRSGASPRSRSR